MVGNGGTVLTTSDGGATWTDVFGLTGRLLATTAYLDGVTNVTVGRFGLVANQDGPQISGTANNLLDAILVTELSGVAVGANGTFLQTTDGGVTWNATSVGFEDLNGVFLVPP